MGAISSGLCGADELISEQEIHTKMPKLFRLAH